MYYYMFQGKDTFNKAKKIMIDNDCLYIRIFQLCLPEK